MKNRDFKASKRLPQAGILLLAAVLSLAGIDAGAMTLQWTLRDSNGRTLRELETVFSSSIETWKWRRDYIRTPGGFAVVMSERDGDQTSNLVLHPDHLGNPRVISRGSTAVGQATYFPYGESVEDGKRGSIGFTGHEEDEATGLYNMGARVYNPELGRFLSPDPVIGDQWNRYAYVANNPMSFVDPTGSRILGGWASDTGQLHRLEWNETVGEYAGTCTSPELTEVANLFINGIRNDYMDAARNGSQQLGFPDVYHVFHNPTRGAFGDLVESSLMKVLGRSSLSAQLEGILLYEADSLQNITAHSQGSLVTSGALKRLPEGSLEGVNVSFFGPAVSRRRGQRSADHVDAASFGFTSHPADFVGNVISTSPGSAHRFVRSVFSFPLLFASNSPHSTYILSGCDPNNPRNLSWY